MEQLTRRNFVAGTAATAALTAVAAQTAPTVARAAEPAWAEEFDIVVVGAGIAGLTAAATVITEAPELTCLLIEKEDSAAGCSPYCHGDALFTDDVEGAFQYLREMCGCDGFQVTPDAPLHAFAEGIAENLDWIKSIGAVDDELVIQTADDIATDGDAGAATAGLLSFAPEWPEYTHSRCVAGWWFDYDNDDVAHRHVWSFLDEYVRANAGDVVDYRCNAKMDELVQDPETKEVLGCVYTEEGVSKYVKANKGVIMTCGGFENNPRMKADYLSAPFARRIAGKCNEGDGITMCARCGADMWHMNSCAGFWTSMSAIDSDTAQMRTSKNLGITVGCNGRRFYMDWDADVAEDWDTFGERNEYSLSLHVGSRHGHMQFGGEWPMPEVNWFICDATAYAELTERLSFDPMDGWGYTADTIEDLAAVINVPVDELVTTVNQWNECCANGEDIFFHRPASKLTPVAEGPFYALYCAPTMLNTDGGPRRSPKGEILDLDGQPIPHLYSAGEFGSVWSAMYQGAGNLGECIAFGRISVRNCLGIA